MEFLISNYVFYIREDEKILIFIIGGAHQGKLDYALSMTKFKTDDVIDCLNIEPLKLDEVLNSNKSVIYNFNILIKELLKKYNKEEIVEEKIEVMLKENKKSVIISTEIGYGIVPIDKFERRYRELVGRICCRVARKAEEVHRVVCGIGTVIKGDRYDKNSFDKTL